MGTHTRRNVNQTRQRTVKGAIAVLGLAVALPFLLSSNSTGPASEPVGALSAESRDVAIQGPEGTQDSSPDPDAVAMAELEGKTVISLTFDVGHAGQLDAARMLGDVGLAGTFYVTSGFMDESGYLSRQDLVDMQADGHEVGGHTKTLGNLPSLLPDEAARQVCDGRKELMDWGLDVRNFSYPFGSSSQETAAIVSDCGYNGARAYGEAAERPVVSPVPPEDAFNTASEGPVTAAWSLEDLQAAVIRAEGDRGGGWLQLTFQQVGVEDGALAPEVFRDFSAWLAARTSDGSVLVRTVGEVTGGSLQPAVAGPVDSPPMAGENAARNPGLETKGEYGLPQCWRVEGWGDRTVVYSLTDRARTGAWAEQITITDYTDGDAKLMPVLDLGGCSPTVAPGRTYSLRAWYVSTAMTQFDVYYRTVDGRWLYWTSGPYFPASEEYVQAEWTTPPVPEEAVGISFGLNLFAEGQLITDDYAIYDAEGAPALALPPREN